jgi:hypothetical protein
VDQQSDQNQTARKVPPREEAQAPPIRDRVTSVSPPLANVIISDSVREQLDYLEHSHVFSQSSESSEPSEVFEFAEFSEFSECGCIVA